VFECLDIKTELVRAVKQISKSKYDKDEQEKIKNEVEILKNLDHTNILKIFDFYEDKSSFYIVTEICKGGELFDKILN